AYDGSSCASGGDDRLYCVANDGANVRVVRLSSVIGPHRLREVAGGDEEVINGVERDDLLEIFDRPEVFDHQSEHDLIVCPFEVAGDAVALAGQDRKSVV